MLQKPLDHILSPQLCKESIYENGTFVGFMMPLGFKGSKELQYLVEGKLSKKLDNERHRKFGIENGVPTIIVRLKVIYNISIPYIIPRGNRVLKLVLKLIRPLHHLKTIQKK